MIKTIEFIKAPVDQSLLQTYDPVSGTDIATNKELLHAFIEANSRIRKHNADKAALRELLE